MGIHISGSRFILDEQQSPCGIHIGDNAPDADVAAARCSLRAQTLQKDAVVVQQSQEHALDQVQALEEKAADSRAKALLEAGEGLDSDCSK